MLSEDRKIKTRAQLREYLAADCVRYPLSARRIVPYLLQISEGAILRRHIVLLRKTEYYTNTGRRLLAAFYHARLMKFQNRYCLHVPVNSCGKGLWIAHVAPVLINGNATVGEYCFLAPMISLAGGEQDLAPTLGDHVEVGIGSLLIGGITIADGITVGAGAVVTKSFLEPGITIAGVPAKKLRAPDGAGTGGQSDAP
jgi:serine O-acetyltransferase